MVEGLRELLKDNSYLKLLDSHTDRIVKSALKMYKYEEKSKEASNKEDHGLVMDMKMKTVLLLQRFGVLGNVYRRLAASDEQIDKEFEIIYKEAKQLEKLPEYDNIIKGLELLKKGVSQHMKIDLEVDKMRPREVDNHIYY